MEADRRTERSGAEPGPVAGLPLLLCGLPLPFASTLFASFASIRFASFATALAAPPGDEASPSLEERERETVRRGALPARGPELCWDNIGGGPAVAEAAAGAAVAVEAVPADAVRAAAVPEEAAAADRSLWFSRCNRTSSTTWLLGINVPSRI